MSIVSGSILSEPACSWTDSIWMSKGCEQALQAGFYDTGPGSENRLIITPPPGAGSVPTDVISSNDPQSILAAQSDASYQSFQDWQTAIANTNWGVTSSSSDWSKWVPWALVGVIGIMFVGKSL